MAADITQNMPIVAMTPPQLTHVADFEYYEQLGYETTVYDAGSGGGGGGPARPSTGFLYPR